MNDFIKIYNDIFKENGYVHISAEDLRISNRITLSLQKYNESCKKKERIKQRLSFNEKYETLKKHKKDSSLYKELLALFEFKNECEKNSPVKIKENEINKKRNYIKDVLQRDNREANIKIIYKDILYDANTIIIEKISSINMFTTKLMKKGLFSNV